MTNLQVTYSDEKFHIKFNVNGSPIQFSLHEEDFKTFIFNLDSTLMDKLFCQSSYDNISQ